MMNSDICRNNDMIEQVTILTHVSFQLTEYVPDIGVVYLRQL